VPSVQLDHVQRPLDDAQVAQAEEVHLEQAQLVDSVHFVLGDNRGVLGTTARLRLALHRQVLGQRVARDHHRGGMDPVLAAEPLEALGNVDYTLDVGVGRVHLAQFAGGLVAVRMLWVLLETRPKRCVPAHHQRGHRLGYAVANAVGVPQDSGGIADGGARLDGRERDDLSDMVRAPTLGGVADHLAPVALVEVHVDVGHLLAARVQEPLEQQVVADRVDINYAQAVGDTAARRAPPPGPTRILCSRAWRIRSQQTRK
jgi:hypothetical protein